MLEKETKMVIECIEFTLNQLLKAEENNLAYTLENYMDNKNAELLALAQKARLELENNYPFGGMIIVSVQFKPSGSDALVELPDYAKVYASFPMRRIIQLLSNLK